MARAPTPLIRALRRYLRMTRKAEREMWERWKAGPAYGPPPCQARGAVRRLAQLSGVPEARISEVLNGRRRRFSVAAAARLTLATAVPLEILLGLPLVRAICPACGASVQTTGPGKEFTLERHQLYWCPTRGRRPTR